MFAAQTSARSDNPFTARLPSSPAGIHFAAAGRRRGPAGQHRGLLCLQRDSSIFPGFCAEPQPLLARELRPRALRWNAGRCTRDRRSHTQSATRRRWVGTGSGLALNLRAGTFQVLLFKNEPIKSEGRFETQTWHLRFGRSRTSCWWHLWSNQKAC